MKIVPISFITFVWFLSSVILCAKTKKHPQSAVLILARGGSKGINLKNLQHVGDSSLLAHAIQVAYAAGVEDVTVSTDYYLIALEAIKYGAKVFKRSPITATDEAPSIWGAQEFMHHRVIDILILIQTTSPFLKPKYIEEALRKIQGPPAFDCVFSVKRIHALRWKTNNGVLMPSNVDIGARSRRQDFEGDLVETGAFYISRKHLIEKGLFQNMNCTFVNIPKLESIEVDTEEDLQLANLLFYSNLV